MVGAINQMFPVTGTNGVAVTSLPNGGGTAIALEDSNYRYYSPLICRIIDSGPNSEADFTNYFYWCEVQSNINTATTQRIDKDLDLQIRQDAGSNTEVSDLRNIISAFNADEYFDESHALPTDGSRYVIVLPVRIDAGPTVAPRVRYVIVAGGSTETSPQYPGMVKQAAANNSVVWQFLESHQPI